MSTLKEILSLWYLDNSSYISMEESAKRKCVCVEGGAGGEGWGGGVDSKREMEERKQDHNLLTGEACIPEQ